MQGPAHLVVSWFTAESCGFDNPRSRRIIALAGLSPDFDVIAYIAAYVYFGFDRNLAYENVWVTVHHHYTHGLGFAVLAGCAAWLWARSGSPALAPQDASVRVGLFAFLAVLLHVFFDLIAAGPRFPVYPFWPLNDFGWTVSWSWELKSWPNQVITLSCLVAILLYARLAGRSPLESISYRLDAWVVEITQTGSAGHARDGAVASRVMGLERGVFIRLCVYLTLAVVCAVVVIPVADDVF